jgi:hypothetical protein
VEALTMVYDKECIYKCSQPLVDFLIGTDNKITFKELLLLRKDKKKRLTEGELEIVNQMDTYTLEGLIIQVLALL